mgnify:CR=1 FL=1
MTHTPGRAGCLGLIATLAVLVATSGALRSHPVAARPREVPPARLVDGKLDDWRGTATGLGGTSQYSRGEFVYQDHLFDDLGADTGQRSEQHGTVAAPKGDVRYPTDEARYGNNAADLLELRLAADADNVWIVARMSTLKVPDATVVALAIDTDANAATGGGPWPHAAGLAVAGADVIITLWGTGGTVTSLPGGSPVPLTDVAADTSNENNAIEARVPRSLFGGSSTIRVWSATGLWDAPASTWTPISPSSPTATSPGGGSASVPARAFNVAFRDEEKGSYMEERQAAALKAGDISAFRADVDLGLLQSGDSQPYRIVPGRFYAAIVDEGFSIPPHHEGLAYGGVPGRFAGVGGAALSQTFDFYGRHQPYGLYIPSTYDAVTPLPAALVLHGIGGSHATYNSQPGFLRDMGEGNGKAGQPPLLMVTPLGRGSSFYADWGEADVLAVVDDVLSRFPVDQERLYLTGYSMGGYGVYRLSALYPDRFAAAASWVGYSGEFIGAYLTDPAKLAGLPPGIVPPIGNGRSGKPNIGDPVDTLENLRHLPLVHLAGSNDQIVPTSGQYAAPRRLAELGYRSRFDLYPGYEHFAFAIVDDWKQVRSWLGNRRREPTPRQIDYKFSDGWTAPGLAAQLELVHDGGWWLRGLSMREPTEDALTLASAKATSWGVNAPSVTVERTTTAVTDPTPHTQQLVSWKEGTPLPTANRLDLDLQGVGAASVDVAAAGLQTCGLVIGYTTDGPTTLRLAGSVPPGTQVSGPGLTSSPDKQDAGIVVELAKSANAEMSITCSRGTTGEGSRGSLVADTGPAQLPATGGKSSPVPAFAVAALAGLAFVRRFARRTHSEAFSVPQ